MATLIPTISSFYRITSKFGFSHKCFSTVRSRKYPTYIQQKFQQVYSSSKRYLLHANSRTGVKAKTIVVGTSLSFLGIGAATSVKDEVTKKYEKKEENVEDRIHHELVKAEVIRGILRYYKGDYEAASDTLKKSLALSDGLLKDGLITDTDSLNHHCFIHNTLANHAYKLQQYSEARTHFTQCIQTCVRLGMAPDDNSIIDMSIKLAVCFGYLQKDEFAKDGFRYSIMIQQKKVDADPKADSDTLALLGIAYEEYGRFYLQKNYFVDGETMLSKALDICKKVMGENDDQCLRILNDIATCNVMQAKYVEAEKMLKDGIRMGHEAKSLIEVAFRSNLGAVYLRQEKYKEAEQECKVGLDLATKANDEYLRIPCQECLRKVKYAKNMSEGEKLREALRKDMKMKEAA